MDIVIDISIHLSSNKSEKDKVQYTVEETYIIGSHSAIEFIELVYQVQEVYLGFRGFKALIRVYLHIEHIVLECQLLDLNSNRHHTLYRVEKSMSRGFLKACSCTVHCNFHLKYVVCPRRYLQLRKAPRLHLYRILHSPTTASDPRRSVTRERKKVHSLQTLLARHFNTL